MEAYIVNIEVPKGECNINNRLTSKYDKVYNKKLYTEGDDNGYPVVYNKLHNDIVKGVIPSDKQLVVTSMDSAVVSAVMTGLSQKYMFSKTEKGKTHFRSNLNIIYIDSYPDNELITKRDFNSLNARVMSNAMSQVTPTYTNHALNIYPEQVVMFGLNDKLVGEGSKTMMKQLGCTHYYLKNIRKKGLADLLESRIERYNDCNDPVFVSIDLSVLNQTACPSVHRIDFKNKEGLSHKEYVELLTVLKKIKNLVGICITGYDFSLIDDEKIKESCDMLTASIIRESVTSLTSIKEKSINIFDENTYFLIWRYVDDEEDYGWYILRNCSLDFREKLISTRLQDDDTIITETFTDDDGNEMDVMITKTNIHEQQSKSYLSGGTYLDCMLFPAEKVAMMFEMLNTPQATVNGEEKTTE